jgi:MFS family permease
MRLAVADTPPHEDVRDEKQTQWYDFITINIYWFALTTRSQVLTPLIVPVLVQRFVGDAVKGTYMGRMRLWALMVAILVQALMGYLSDRSTSRWGRRRPFIAVGTLGEIVVFVLMGLTLGLRGMQGYVVLFVLYILSMISSNTAHAATQGLIPDLVPESERGRFSGVKALLELPVPLIFSSFVVAGMVSRGNLWGALISMMVVLSVCALITMFAKEAPLDEPPTPFDWQPLIRLAVMTGAFTVIILGAGASANGLMRAVEPLSLGLRSALTGAIGVGTMILAVVAGVWASVAISIGQEIRNHRSFTWWVTGRLAFMVASTNLAAFMLYFLQDRFPGLSGEAAADPAAKVMMFVGLAIVVVALPSGWLADKFGKKLLVGTSGALGFVGTLLILLIPEIWMMYAGGAVVGAGIGLFYAANWALGTEVVPQEEAGRYLGLSNLSGAGAGAIGAYIGGPIADANGYVLLFAIYAVMFALSIFALWGVEEQPVSG